MRSLCTPLSDQINLLELCFTSMILSHEPLCTTPVPRRGSQRLSVRPVMPFSSNRCVRESPIVQDALCAGRERRAVGKQWAVKAVEGDVGERGRV